MIAGFADGVIQFFLPTHLLAVVALGLMIGRAQRIAVQLALFAFGLLIGSMAIAYGMRETPSAIALLAFAACAGIIVLLALKPPASVSGVLSCLTGAAIALNSPPQALTVPVAVASQFGSAAAALATLALAAFIAMKAERDWQRIGIRIIGSWIAASAILVLALRLTR
jgi:hypothetical protein